MSRTGVKAVHMAQGTDNDHTPRTGRRRLLAQFDTLEQFQVAYRKQIANGGMFVASRELFHVGERLELELRMVFRTQSILIPAEVVSFVPLRFVPPGAEPGVSVQFTMPAPVLRARLDPIANVGRPPQATLTPEERRDATRVPARVPAQVETHEGALIGRTRDLSRSGVLVSVDSTPVPVGQQVRLTLAHPSHGEERELLGTVVRHVTEGPGAPALAIRFETDRDDREEALRFIDSVQSAERARRLGTIEGPIELLGLATLLQMFSSGADGGTVRVQHGAHQGIVVFEAGTLVYARFGEASALKALSRMLALPSGTFEFRAEIDRSFAVDSPLPMYSAVLQAAHQLDERNRLDSSGLDPDLQIAVDPTALAEVSGRLEKLEQAIVDMARTGITVQEVLDALPDSDAEICLALLGLREQGVIALEG